jgi:hypothetical protein
MQSGAKAPGCEATAAAPIHEHRRAVGAAGADRETMSPTGYPLPRRSATTRRQAINAPPAARSLRACR